MSHHRNFLLEFCLPLGGLMEIKAAKLSELLNRFIAEMFWSLRDLDFLKSLTTL